MEHIGIDTHGLDCPPEERELTDAEAEALSEIEQRIADLVGHYKRISGGDLPYIGGYKAVAK